MGYSKSREAGRTLDLLDTLCRQQNKSSNTWEYKGKKYFYDITRKDQPDGGVRGTVHECIGDEFAKQVGYFNIDGDGIIVKFPGWPTDLIAKPVTKKRSSYGW